MKVSIRISAATKALIYSKRDPLLEFVDTAKPIPGSPGWYYIQISPDTFQRLRAHQLPGESLNDVITRLIQSNQGVN